MSLLLLFATPAAAVVPPVTPPVVTVIYSHGTASPGMSETMIGNLALSHLGHSKAVTDIWTERSTEARACAQWYTLSRDELLRSFAWAFATQPGTALALVAYTPSGPEWTYTYSYPSDAILLLRAPYGSTRNPTLRTLTRYRLQRNPLGGMLIYTDQDLATMEFVVRVTDPEEYPPDFVVALSYLLASRICAQVVSENASQRALTMMGLYKQAAGTAMTHAANEQVPDIPNDSDFILARN